jgi:hypothetical protein
MGSDIFTVNGKKYTNKHGIADIFVRAVTEDDYTREGADYSTSDFTSPPKAVALIRKHHDEIVTDVSDRFAIFRGHGLHRELERHAGANSLSEERLHAEMGRYMITTKPDHYDGDTKIVADLKSTSVWAFMRGVKAEWEQQLNVQAWFIRNHGFTVKGLMIHAALYDWNRNESRRNEDYPQTAFHSIEVPMWTHSYTEGWIEISLNRLVEASIALINGDSLPTCTPEERWQSETTYALIKKGNKRATKVCENMTQAEAYKEGHKDGAKMDIIERPGEAKRCANYCDAAPWCEQYQEEVVDGR